MAMRRYAFYVYARAAGCLSQHRDWAAQCLLVSTPPLFGDLIGPVQKGQRPPPQANAAEEPSAGNKRVDKGDTAAQPELVFLGEIVATCPEDARNRRRVPKDKQVGAPFVVTPAADGILRKGSKPVRAQHPSEQHPGKGPKTRGGHCVPPSENFGDTR